MSASSPAPTWTHSHGKAAAIEIARPTSALPTTISTCLVPSENPCITAGHTEDKFVASRIAEEKRRNRPRAAADAICLAIAAMPSKASASVSGWKRPFTKSCCNASHGPPAASSLSTPGAPASKAYPSGHIAALLFQLSSVLVILLRSSLSALLPRTPVLYSRDLSPLPDR